MARLAKMKIESNLVVDLAELSWKTIKIDHDFEIELDFKFDELPLALAKLNDNRIKIQNPLILINLETKEDTQLTLINDLLK